MRDIRDHIAKTPQTDPNNFDRAEFSRYPLMPTDKDGKPVLDRMKRPIILQDAAEEDAFYDKHPDLDRIVDPQNMKDELTRLREENARLRGDADAKTPNKEDNVTQPITTEQVQQDALQGSGVGRLARPAKPAPAAPKPGSKLE